MLFKFELVLGLFTSTVRFGMWKVLKSVEDWKPYWTAVTSVLPACG